MDTNLIQILFFFLLFHYNLRFRTEREMSMFDNVELMSIYNNHFATAGKEHLFWLVLAEIGI